jgi:hypothetical protein
MQQNRKKIADFKLLHKEVIYKTLDAAKWHTNCVFHNFTPPAGGMTL